MAAADSAERQRNEATYWAREVRQARKRFETFRKNAKRITDIYEAETKRENSFNVLYSNTETLLPACYSTLPIPMATRRFKDADPMGKLVCEVTNRALAYALDTPDQRYTPMQELFEGATLGGLLSGFGLTRFKYDVDLAATSPLDADKAKTVAAEGTDDKSGDVTPSLAAGKSPTFEEVGEEVTYEAVCGVDVPYDKVLWGYAHAWTDTPWIAFEHSMSRADIKSNFGEKWVTELEDRFGKAEFDKSEDDPSKEKEVKESAEVVVVHEIWHKSTRQVVWYCDGYLDSLIGDKMDDPLGLSGFYPCPKPLLFLKKKNTTIPTAPYLMYEEQAKELNKITLRINKLIAALKVRGFYNESLKGLSNLLTKDDNTFIPAEGAMALQNMGTLAQNIFMFPLNEIITTLQQLYVQRQQCKQVIYEITGISDILRGSSVASETATAQNIKNQWGTLRLKNMQGAVQTYCRDSLRIMAEIIGGKFGEDTLAAMCGMDDTVQTSMQKDAAVQQLQAMQQQMQQQPPAMPAAAPPDPNAPPGQPSAPPQPDPGQQQMQEQVQQLTEAAQKPSWGDVLTLMRDTMSRDYKIDIETNSTIDASATEDKSDIADLMQAVAQLAQGFTPLMQMGLPMTAFKGMLLAVCRRFNFGPQIEDFINQMPDQAPQPQQDKGKEAEVQAKLQLTQAETQGKLAIMDKKLQVEQKELELKEQQLALQQQELDQKKQINTIKFEGQMQTAMAKREQAAAQAAMTAAMPQGMPGTAGPMGGQPGQMPPAAAKTPLGMM